jgi:hypothetical protein
VTKNITYYWQLVTLKVSLFGLLCSKLTCPSLFANIQLKSLSCLLFEGNSSGYATDISRHDGAAYSETKMFKSSAVATLAASMVWYFILSTLVSMSH